MACFSSARLNAWLVDSRPVNSGVGQLRLWKPGLDMNSKCLFLFSASALAFVVGIVSFVLLMEMYDLKPGFWGPQGVEFDEWHKVWAARRDLYMWIMAGSFFSALGFIIAGASLMDGQRRLTTY